MPMARARGFDRILKYRERYIDEIRSDAAAMHLKNMTLEKKDDVGRSGGETFDSPEVEHHRSVSEVASSSDVSGASDSDASSGLIRWQQRVLLVRVVRSGPSKVKSIARFAS